MCVCVCVCLCVCDVIYGVDIYCRLLVSMQYADRAKRVRDNIFFPKTLEVCLILKLS